MHRITAKALLLAGLIGVICPRMAAATTDLYRLVWTDDPATTMTVGWRQTGGAFTAVRYREKGGLGLWQSEAGLVVRQFQNTVHGVADTLDNSFVKLTGLAPDTDYEFRICDSDGCSERYMWFRTAPATGKAISFVAGGDSRRDSGNFANNDRARTEGMRLVSKIRPLFVLFSGDFMNDGTFEEWLVWLDEWQLTQSSDGRMYPIVPTHGNHENDGLDMVQNIFNVEGPAGNPAFGTYNALGLGGDMLRIWTLNTELEPGVGYAAFQGQSGAAWDTQNAWLAADLAAHPDVTWKLANYHRPLRPHTSSKSEGVGRYDAWAPLFDQHDVDLAIESDTHMVKYTYPVRHDPGGDEGFSQADYGNGEHGTVFIGEGSWGAPKRPIDDDKSWTLVSNSFWQFKVIHVSPTALDIRTVRFEPGSYPNGVDADVAELSQAALDMSPGLLPAGLDLWRPLEGDGPLTLPFVDVMPKVQSGQEGSGNSLFFHDFDDGTFGGITIVDLACDDHPEGDDNWRVVFGEATINGFNNAAADPQEQCDDWMILPAIDMTAEEAVTLTFISAYDFNGPALELKYSSSYVPGTDPSTATWTDLVYNQPPGDGFTDGASGPVVIEAAAVPESERGGVYIAFRYTSNGRGPGDGRAWDVDDVQVVGGDQSPGGLTTETFDSGTLGTWQAVNKAEGADWGPSVVDGRPAAFANNTFTFTEADAWLVSPVFAIPDPATDVAFKFDYRWVGETSQVPASENMQLLVLPGCALTGDYGAADIDPAQWIVLQDSFSQASASWIAHSPLDLGTYAGQDICLAFRYRDGGLTARQWAVDELGFGAPVVDAVPLTPPGALRVAAFNVLLADRGAGDLVADLATGTDSQAKGIAEIIQRVAPDVVLLNEFDYDAGEQAIQSFKDLYLAVSQNGAPPIDYPYHYVAISNTGVQPEDEGEADCDFNDPTVGCDAGGNNDDPEDAFGFGRYSGAFAMALLSKHPIDMAGIRTFRKYLWADMPAAVLPYVASGAGYYQPDELAIFRLSSKSHWDIPVLVEGETIHVLASHPTPPVFDGSEDRNGRRNHDEIRLWEDYVSLTGDDCYLIDDAGVPGCLGTGRRFVIMGDQNADPVNGDSFADAILQLLNNRRVDGRFVPLSSGGAGATSGLAATADFGLRADYVLPSTAGLEVVMDACDRAQPGLSCGIFWPRSTDPLVRLTGNCSASGPGCASSDHRMVWLDLRLIEDQDGDGIPDDVDICPNVADTHQGDLDRDGLGDACDSDDDGDGMDDDWEIRYGLNPADPSDANMDSDGDGTINLEEFLAGTNPQVADGGGDPDSDPDEEIPLPAWALWLLAGLLGWLGLGRRGDARVS